MPSPPGKPVSPLIPLPENASMRRSLLPPALSALLLAACAPTATGTRPTPDGGFRAAFSEQGVVWVSGGRACVARVPEYAPVCPRLPRVADVAWNGPDAWAAVPELGQTVTLDGAARSVPVGRVVALSATRAYREDGSAVTFAGQPARGLPFAPLAVVTGGNGQDYALVRGRAGTQLLRVSDGAVLEAQAGPELLALPAGARSATEPQVVTPFGSYVLANGRLERRDGAGRVMLALPHEPGRVGLVGQDVVTVDETGRLRRFTADLQER